MQYTPDNFSWVLQVDVGDWWFDSAGKKEKTQLQTIWINYDHLAAWKNNGWFRLLNFINYHSGDVAVRCCNSSKTMAQVYSLRAQGWGILISRDWCNAEIRISYDTKYRCEHPREASHPVLPAHLQWMNAPSIVTLAFHPICAGERPWLMEGS
jgi:hypothetical protein